MSSHFSLAFFVSSFLIFCYIFINPAEDAVILYEYSKTLAETGVISYGNNGHPIEGATDFLWMLIISLFSFIGIDEFLASLILTSSALVYIFKQLDRLEYGIILILICLLFTPYLYSSAQGFSAIFFSAFYIQCLIFLKNTEFKKMYLAILLLCLVRPDGVVWAAPLVLLHQIEGGIKLEKIKELLFILIIPGVAYFILRYCYFGELLPLPFYVKSAGVRDFITFFLSSIIYVSYCALPFVIYFIIKKDWKSLFIISIPILFFSSMALSQNIGNRFLAPMFFGGLILLESKSIDRVVVVVFSIILSLSITLSTVLNSLETKNENIFQLSKSLHGIDGKMLISEAGRLAYYSEWFVHDSWGLNTPKYSRKLITPKDILTEKYDLIAAHCYNIHSLLENENEMTQRTWNNQCLNISIAIQDDYDKYLVPFKIGETPLYSYIKGIYREDKGTVSASVCNRYDLYSVKNTSLKKKDIIKILLKHGAIPYSKDLNLIGDKVCS
jgi:hypothetical protein